MQPTQQQVLSWSSDLRKMLKSDAFEYAVQLLRADYQNRFFTSGPLDHQDREHAYLLNQTLNDLLSSMETVVFVGENMEE